MKVSVATTPSRYKNGLSAIEYKKSAYPVSVLKFVGASPKYVTLTSFPPLQNIILAGSSTIVPSHAKIALLHLSDKALSCRFAMYFVEYWNGHVEDFFAIV